MPKVVGTRFIEGQRLRSVKRILLLFASTLFLALIFLAWWRYDGVNWYEGRREKVGPPFEAGNKVLKYLGEYRAKYGKYPESLDALVPEFTDHIPAPEWGTNSWTFFFDDEEGRHFNLVVKQTEEGFWGHVYWDALKSWHYDNSQ